MYRRLAEVSADPEIGKLFSGLSSEEALHLSNLKKVITPSSLKRGAVKEEHIERIFRSAKATLSAGESGEEKTGVLAAALLVEERTLTFYLELHRANHGDPALAALLSRLADEERDHISRLESRLKTEKKALFKSASDSLSSAKSSYSLFAFFLSVSSAVGYRLIYVSETFSWGIEKFLWYYSTTGFLLFFLYLSRLASKRASIIRDYHLLNRLRGGAVLNDEENKVLTGLLESIYFSREKLNYRIIFLVSVAALLLVIGGDFFWK
ncbi:MAG: hypothetical protein ACLFQK_02290 [Fibrobacterota bacterium]